MQGKAFKEPNNLHNRQCSPSRYLNRTTAGTVELDRALAQFLGSQVTSESTPETHQQQQR